VVFSPSLSLSELSQRLGRPHSSGSHSKGDARMRDEAENEHWKETIWRLDSDAAETDSIEEHFERLEAQFPAKDLRSVLPPDCEVGIDIVLFFNTMTVSAHITRTVLNIIEAYQAVVEITCYPTDFERDE
jgi:hypothetical protein